MIWKNPWMAVSANTFTGSMLTCCGLGERLPHFLQKYPAIDLHTETDKASTLLLFPTEPFPFLKKREDLDELGFPYAFINGGELSWFDVRSLRFLQKR